MNEQPNDAPKPRWSDDDSAQTRQRSRGGDMGVLALAGILVIVLIVALLGGGAVMLLWHRMQASRELAEAMAFEAEEQAEQARLNEMEARKQAAKALAAAPDRGEKPRPIAVAHSADGQRVAVASADGVNVWEAAADRELTHLPDARAPLAFSPDGTKLASASTQPGLTIWDVKTGRAIHKLPGPLDGVAAIAFSPDGKHLALAGREVKLWDVETGDVEQLGREESGFVSVRFRPDGKRLTAVGGDGRVHGWDVPAHRE